MSNVPVMWYGYDGSQWDLSGSGRDHGGVILTQVADMVAQVDREVTLKSTGRGSFVNGMTYPGIEGVLSFNAADDLDLGLKKGEVYRNFKDSWATKKPGRLVVVTSTSRAFSIDAYLAAVIPATEFSPWSTGFNSLDFDIQVYSTDGLWVGDERVWGGGSATVPNWGDVDIYPVVRWTGNNQSVTFGDLVVDLPSTPAGEYRRLSTDPSEGFVITDDSGNIDVSRWSARRGKTALMLIKSGHVEEFEFSSGVELLTRELLENPWG